MDDTAARGSGRRCAAWQRGPVRSRSRIRERAMCGSLERGADRALRTAHLHRACSRPVALVGAGRLLLVVPPGEIARMGVLLAEAVDPYDGGGAVCALGRLLLSEMTAPESLVTVGIVSITPCSSPVRFRPLGWCPTLRRVVSLRILLDGRPPLVITASRAGQSVVADVVGVLFCCEGSGAAAARVAVCCASFRYPVAVMVCQEK